MVKLPVGYIYCTNKNRFSFYTLILDVRGISVKMIKRIIEEIFLNMTRVTVLGGIVFNG